MHERCENECLATRATTVVEYCLLRLAVNSHAQQLAGLILHLKVSLLELGHRKEVACGRLKEADAIWCVLRGPNVVTKGFKLAH